MAGVGQDGEQSAQEAQCEEVVEVAFEAGFAFDRGGNVGLSTEPGHEGVGGVVVAFGDEAAVCADRHREHRRTGGYVGQAAL